jgi:hypothetical protein
VASTATEIKEVLPSQIRAISPFVDRLVLVLKPFIEKSKAVVRSLHTRLAMCKRDLNLTETERLVCSKVLTACE